MSAYHNTVNNTKNTETTYMTITGVSLIISCYICIMKYHGNIGGYRKSFTNMKKYLLGIKLIIELYIYIYI